jgi:hypothetical protein
MHFELSALELAFAPWLFLTHERSSPLQTIRRHGNVAGKRPRQHFYGGAVIMKFKKWEGFFGHQCDLLFNNNYPPVDMLVTVSPAFLHFGDAFCALEDEHVVEVEKAIRKFARTRKWPKMSDPVGSLVTERLMAAEQLIDDMQFIAKTLKMGPPTRRMTDEKIILWFLIETWDEFNFENQVNAMRCAPYPFSPLVKAKGNLRHFGRN